MDEYIEYTDTLNKIYTNEELLHKANTSVEHMQIYDELNYIPEKEQAGKLSFIKQYNLEEHDFVTVFPNITSISLCSTLLECYKEKPVHDAFFTYNEELHSLWNSHRIVVLPDICVIKDSLGESLDQYIDIHTALVSDIVLEGNDHLEALSIILEKRFDKLFSIAAGYHKPRFVLEPFAICTTNNEQSCQAIVEVITAMISKYRYSFEEIVLVNTKEQYTPYFEAIQRSFKKNDETPSILAYPAYITGKRKNLIDQENYKIGRSLDNNLRIFSRSVKPQAMQILYRNGEYYADSQDSTVLLNGLEIKAMTKLQDQDELLIGNKLYTFTVTKQPDANLRDVIEEYCSHASSTNYETMLESIASTPLYFPISSKVLMVYEEDGEVILPGYFTVEALKEDVDSEYTLLHPDIYLEIMLDSEATVINIGDMYTLTREEAKRILK